MNQKDPDWVILRSAERKRTRDGVNLVDVQFFNSGQVQQPSLLSVLGFFDGNFSQCHSIGEYFNIPVLILKDQCIDGAAINSGSGSTNSSCDEGSSNISVFSGDAQDPTLIDRNIEYRTGGCGEIWTEVELGGTGPIPSMSSLRLRYTFQTETGELEDLFFLPGNYVRFLGGRLWPQEIAIE